MYYEPPKDGWLSSILCFFYQKQKKKQRSFWNTALWWPGRESSRRALTICFANILFYIPFGSAHGEPPKDGWLSSILCFVLSDTKRKNSVPFGTLLCGDPDENRTRVTAVKGRCLNRLTTGPNMRGLTPFYITPFVGKCVGKTGSGSGIRTYDQSGMNRVL